MKGFRQRVVSRPIHFEIQRYHQYDVFMGQAFGSHVNPSSMNSSREQKIRANHPNLRIKSRRMEPLHLCKQAHREKPPSLLWLRLPRQQPLSTIHATNLSPQVTAELKMRSLQTRLYNLNQGQSTRSIQVTPQPCLLIDSTQ